MEYSYKPTTHGRSVMAACMALEKPLKIRRVAFGSGKVDEGVNLADVHELISYVSDGAVAERRHENERLYLTVQYANKDHPDVKMFMLSEFIVYTEDPETRGETDLLYGTLGDYRQPVPAYNQAIPPSVFNFPLELIISDEVQISVSAPAGLVTHAELVKLLGGLGTASIEITVPAEGWEADEDTGGKYPRHVDIPVASATERHVPTLTILPQFLDVAADCGLGNVARTLDGALRVYAQQPPETPISAILTLQGIIPNFGEDTSAFLPSATATRLGGVKVRQGSGLVVDKEGNLTVDAANAGDAENLFGSDAGNGVE